jgi:hypothetical protein
MPLVLHAPRVRLLLVLLAAAAVAAGLYPGAASADLSFDHAVVDGTVLALAEGDDALYLGGRFDSVGPFTGGGALLDAATAARLTPFPEVNGFVSCVVPDGSGGWFLGGSFLAVGGEPRQNLAHVTASGDVGAFNPGASSQVLALALAGDTLLAGGSFTGLGGSTRLRIGALNASTGALLSWNPGAGATVRSLNVYGDVVFAGGDFTSIGGASRDYLAALDRATGLATAWNPDPSFLVWTLARSGTTLYAGGNFTTIGGQSIQHLAAIDANTGAVSAWAPQPNAPVHAIVIDGGTVYLGGPFQSVAGTTRKSLAAVSAATGALTAWQPALTPDFSTVDALIQVGTTLYLGGTFRSVGGQNRDRLAAVSTVDAQPLAWDPVASGPATCLAFDAGRVLTGGTFTSVTGVRRRNLAALSLVDGQPLAWNPGADDSVFTLALAGDTLYAGGRFLNCGGQPRARLAALGTMSDGALAWNPGADLAVRALLASGDRLFAGGEFAQIAGVVRSSLAALHRTTGAVRPWNPVLTNIFAPPRVNALLLKSDTLIVGGALFVTNPSFHVGIASFDTTLDGSLDWGASASPEVFVLHRADSLIYVGGNVGGGGLVAFHATTGAATTFQPIMTVGGIPGSRVFGLSTLGNRLYAAGTFTDVDGVPRQNLAAFDRTDHSLTDWDPGANGVANALIRCGNRLVAGGSFTLVDDRLRRGVAVLEDPAVSAVPDRPPVAGRLRLEALWPNPATDRAQVRLAMDRPGRVRGTLFDVLGRPVRPGILDETLAAGVHERALDLSGLAGGVYLLRVTTADGVLLGRVAVRHR